MSDPSEAHHNQAWTAYQDCDHATEFMVCDDCVAKAIAAAEERGRRAGIEEATARLAVWDDHLRVVGSVHACERLLEAARAAYEHLDSFGVVAGGTPREHESQRRAFDMLRPFVTRALAPRDSAPVCWKCGAPYRDAGACGYCQAPRDSGEGEHYDVPCLCGDGSVDPMRCPAHRPGAKVRK